MATSRPSAPRSLADDLRARDDADLVALLRSRPDLTSPMPADVTSLAARAGTRASVQRALDRLPATALQVVEVLAVLPEPATATAVSRHWGAKAGPVLRQLREQGLVWGPDSALRLVRAARDVLGAHPAGLGPPLSEAMARCSPSRLSELLEDLGLEPAGDTDTGLRRLCDHLSDRDVLTPMLDQAPRGVRALLDELVWGPPVGRVAAADRPVRTSTAGTPVEWLLARGVLAVVDAGHVLLPREVALVLRGGMVHRSPATSPPEPHGTARPPAMVEAVAASAAAEAVRLVEELCEIWGLSPPPLLRAGGLGVRELRRTAAALDVDETDAALVAETAYVSGLVADDGHEVPVWAPTPGYDVWRSTSLAQRWAVLADAWARSTRVAGLVGTRDARGAARNALGADLDRPAAAPLRAAVLAELAGMDHGEAPDPESVVERLDWATPRRAGALRRDLVVWTLREAGWLGVTGAGALSSFARSWLVDGDAAGAAALAAVLPLPVDHVLLQADLTAVAPGPLEPELARELAVAADVESRGGATVYRFTPESIRRALDSGRAVQELLDFFATRSRTPVPQPLTYLVHDVARRHGRVRVGTANAYLRADDESVLSELLADRRTAALRLHRLAPTVVVAQADATAVLATLRSMGLAPAAESIGGELLVRRPDSRRTPVRQRPQPVVVEPLPPLPSVLAAVVRALRAGDATAVEAARHAAGAAEAPRMDPMDPSTALAALREAAADRQRVWIGYVDATGRTTRKVVEPIGVDGGRVTAFDHAVDEVRSFSVHRVTGVAPVEELTGG